MAISVKSGENQNNISIDIALSETFNFIPKPGHLRGARLAVKGSFRKIIVFICVANSMYKGKGSMLKCFNFVIPIDRIDFSLEQMEVKCGLAPNHYSLISNPTLQDSVYCPSIIGLGRPHKTSIDKQMQMFERDKITGTLLVFLVLFFRKLKNLYLLVFRFYFFFRSSI